MIDGATADDVGGHLEGVVHRRGGHEPEPPDRRRMAADDDHPGGPLLTVGSPIPGIERVDTVVGVAGAVEVAVPLVLGVLLLPLLTHDHRVGGIGEHLLEEIDVARVVHRVELRGTSGGS